MVTTTAAQAPAPTVREATIAVARQLMVDGEWAHASMAEVARLAGVSRQTLYNDFGNRDGLAAAVAQETADQFRRGALEAAGTAMGVSAIARAVEWSLSAAAADPLIRAGLTDDAAGLLPFLTTRSADLLMPLVAAVAATLPDPGAEWACEVALRMTVSHLLMPVRSDAEHVAAVTDLIAPLLTTPT